MRLDAGAGRMASEYGVGLIGMVALVDQDSDGSIDGYQLVHASQPRDQGGRRKVDVEGNRSAAVANWTVLPLVGLPVLC